MDITEYVCAWLAFASMNTQLEFTLNVVLRPY